MQMKFISSTDPTHEVNNYLAQGFEFVEMQTVAIPPSNNNYSSGYTQVVVVLRKD